MYAILKRLFFGGICWIFWMSYHQFWVEISIQRSRSPFPHFPSPYPRSIRCGWQHWWRFQVPTEKRQILWRKSKKFHSSPRYIDFPSASYWQHQPECAFLQNQQLSVAPHCPPIKRYKSYECPRTSEYIYVLYTSQVAEYLPLAQSENWSSMSSVEYRDRHLSLSTRKTLNISNSKMVFYNRRSFIFSQQKFELSIINENTSPLPLEGCLLCAYCQSFPSLGKIISFCHITFVSSLGSNPDI